VRNWQKKRKIRQACKAYAYCVDAAIVPKAKITSEQLAEDVKQFYEERAKKMQQLIEDLKKLGLIGEQNYEQLACDIAEIVTKEKEFGGEEFGVSAVQRNLNIGYNRACRALEAGVKYGVFQNDDTSAVYKYSFVAGIADK
jgi:DNA segregation ATPase FtsK/SpoIIIE-like protein